MAQSIPSTCTTCGAPLPTGSDRCGRCGTLHGEHRRCSGCGAKAEVIAKGGLRYVCAACGRPRVPIEQPGVIRSGAEREPLARAEADLKNATLATALGIVAAVSAGLVVMGALLAWLVDFGLLATGFGVFAAMVGAAAAFAFVTSKKAKQRADDAMRDAFGSVALDVMRQRGTVTSRALAEILGVPEPVADAALARLPARSDVRVDTVVDDRAAADGLVRYRLADGATLPAETLDDAADAEHASFEARLRAAMRDKGQP